jgi:two-component system LytT family response regulator
MGAIERRLDPGRFVRIHRSAIVKVDKVKELRPAFHGEFEVVLSSDRRLRCSRTYAAELTRVMES